MLPALDVAARQLAAFDTARTDIQDTIRKMRQLIDHSRAFIAEVDARLKKRHGAAVRLYAGVPAFAGVNRPPHPSGLSSA
jgi:hypothetical protein